MVDIIGAGIVVGGTLVVLLPVFKLLSKTMIKDRMEDRKREWRLLAAKLSVIDYQAIVFINGVRQMLGQPKLDEKPALESVEDWKWKDLMSDAKASVNKAVNDINARWGATQ